MPCTRPGDRWLSIDHFMSGNAPFLGRAEPRRSLIASGIVASAGTDSRDVSFAVSEIGARSRKVLEAARLAIGWVRDR